MARSALVPVYTEVPTMGIDGRTVLSGAVAPTSTVGRIGDFYVDLVGKKLYGPKNAAGWPDNGLIKGDRGWVPVLASVTDSTRRVFRVVDWAGGEGTKPATGKYVGTTGLVDLIADAVDMRGAEGPEMLIDALDNGADDVTYEDNTAVAKDGDDNKRHSLKQVLGAGGLLQFETVADAEALVIPASVKSVQINGETTANGAPGQIRRRVDSEPAVGLKHRSADRFTSDGGSDSANGGWWAVAGEVIPEMFGALINGSTNDSVAFGAFEAFAPSSPVDLNGRAAVVSSVPHAARYSNGSFKVGTEIISLPSAPRMHPFTGRISSEGASPGTKWPAGVWYDAATRRLWRAEQVAERHDTTTGSRIDVAYSDDAGETWLARRTVFSSPTETRVRAAAFGQMSSGRYGGIVTTGPDVSYKNFFASSDDAGATWAIVEITSGLTVPGFVYGIMMPGPSGASGDFIVAAYAETTPGAKMFRTMDNGATWNCTLLKNSTGLPGVAQEPSLVFAPGVGWVMFVRTSANGNVWAATSADLITWSAWVDCGANLGANPVHALYDGGSIHLFISERDGFPGTTRPNEVYCYSVNAAAVYANPAVIGLRAPTRIATLASRAIGYMQSCRIARSVNDVHAPWYHVMKVGEGQTTARGTRSQVVSIRDLPGASASTGAVAEVVQLIDNPIFTQWPRGTSFAAFTTDRGLAGRWRSICSGATLTVERVSLTEAQRTRFSFRPLYGMRVANTGAPDNFSGITQRWDGADAINIARTIQRSGDLICRMYGIGACPSGARASLAVNGTSYATGTFPAVPSSQTASWVAEVRLANTAVPADLSVVTQVTFAIDNGAAPSEFDYTLVGVFVYPADCARVMEFNEPSNTAERVSLYCQSLSGNGRVIANGVAFSSTDADIWMPINMAMSPAVSTISAAADFNIISQGGSVACSALTLSASATQIKFDATMAGATAGVAKLQLGAGAVLTLDSGY